MVVHILRSSPFCGRPHFVVVSHLTYLSKGQFHEEDGKAGDEQHDDVRNEKSSAAILVAQIRESPNVAQTHGVRNARQQELDLVTPIPTLTLTTALLSGAWGDYGG